MCTGQPAATPCSRSRRRPHPRPNAANQVTSRTDLWSACGPCPGPGPEELNHPVSGRPRQPPGWYRRPPRTSAVCPWAWQRQQQWRSRRAMLQAPALSLCSQHECDVLTVCPLATQGAVVVRRTVPPPTAYVSRVLLGNAEWCTSQATCGRERKEPQQLQLVQRPPPPPPSKSP